MKKERGLKSPDVSDSAALTFAFEVMPPPETLPGKRSRQLFTNKGYEPYAGV